MCEGDNVEHERKHRRGILGRVFGMGEEERTATRDAIAEEERTRMDEMIGAKGTGPSPHYGGLGTLSIGGLRGGLEEKRETRHRLVERLVRVETEIMALERLLG